MKKYYIGLLVIAGLSLVLVFVTVGTGLAEKNDKITEKKITEISPKLDKYISSNRKIPESLDEAGIKDVPSTIKYEKLDNSSYKFCATFKKATERDSGPLLTSLLWGGGIGNSEERDDSYSSLSTDRSSGYLYMYSHKAGENCQTVKPYTLSTSSYRYDSINSFSNNSSQRSTTSAKSTRDTERETDIKTIHARLEAYYAENGVYPTLSELNSASWRTTNMKGVDSKSYIDPAGSSSSFASRPATAIYSYEVTSDSGKVCDNKNTDCTTYVLTATLDSGTTYEKQSLN